MFRSRTSAFADHVRGYFDSESPIRAHHPKSIDRAPALDAGQAGGGVFVMAVLDYNVTRKFRACSGE